MVTSRRRFSNRDIPGLAAIDLPPLNRNTMLKVINARQEETNFRLYDDEIKQIMEIANGNILIAKLAIGLIERKTRLWGKRKSMASEIRVMTTTAAVLQHLFEDLYSTLTEKARRVLAAFAALTDTSALPPSIQKISNVTGFSSSSISAAIDELVKSSLVDRNPTDSNKFDIHPLVRDFVMEEEPDLSQKYISHLNSSK
jgi:hypothetical protein